MVRYPEAIEAVARMLGKGEAAKESGEREEEMRQVICYSTIVLISPDLCQEVPI